MYGWQPYHLHVPNVLKSGSMNLLGCSGLVQACNGMLYLFIPNIYGLGMEIKVTSYFVWAKDIPIVHTAHSTPTFLYMWPRICWKEQNGSTILTWIKDDNIFLIQICGNLLIGGCLIFVHKIKHRPIKYRYFPEDLRLSMGVSLYCSKYGNEMRKETAGSLWTWKMWTNRCYLTTMQ